MILTFLFLDQHLVLMLNTVMNGVNRLVVKMVILVFIVIPELNNSFILKFINHQSVMMCSNQVIVLVGHSAHLLI